MKKIRDKSGAPADLLDFYNENDVSFDIYQDRWQYASHMDFFIPACARSAYTISIGNSASVTNLKRKSTADDSLNENCSLDDSVNI